MYEFSRRMGWRRFVSRYIFGIKCQLNSKVLISCFFLLLLPALSNAATLSVPTSNSTGTYTVSWSGVGNFFELYERTGTSGTWISIDGGTATSGSRQISKSNGTYQYYLKDCVYTSPGSPTCSSTPTRTITVLIQAPSVPSLSLSRVDNGSTFTITLSFGSLGATSYKWQERLNGGAWGAEQTTSAKSVSRPGKGNGTWGYRVLACSSAGCSVYSIDKSIDVAIKPGTPPTISVPTSPTDGNYPVSWGTASGSVSEYDLDRRLNNGGWIDAYDGTATNHSESGLGVGSYTYQVRACKTVGSFTNCSGWKTSNPVSVVATAPTSIPVITLNSTSGNGTYPVSWNATSNTTRYTLQETINGGSWTTVQDDGNTSKSYSGKADNSYGYRVRACNTVGCTNYSAVKVIDVARAPSVPSEISATNQGNGNVIVSWSASSGSTTYDMDRSKDGGGYINTYDDSSLSSVLTNLAPGSYTFRVRSCKTVGSFTNCSGWRVSSIFTMTTAKQVSYEYDELGRLMKVIDVNNIETDYDYDKADNRRSKVVEQLP